MLHRTPHRRSSGEKAEFGITEIRVMAVLWDPAVQQAVHWHKRPVSVRQAVQWHKTWKAYTVASSGFTQLLYSTQGMYKRQSCSCAYHKSARGSGSIAPLILNLGTSRSEPGHCTDPSSLPQQAASSIHSTAAWKGLTAGLDVLENRQISCSCKGSKECSFVQPAAESLYRLNYPGSDTHVWITHMS